MNLNGFQREPPRGLGRLFTGFVLVFLCLVLPDVSPDAAFLWPRIGLLGLFPLLFREPLMAGWWKGRPDLYWLAAFLGWSGLSTVVAGSHVAWLGEARHGMGFVTLLVLAGAYVSASVLPRGLLTASGVGWIAGMMGGLTVIEYLGFRPLALMYRGIDTTFPAVTVGYRGWLAGLLLVLLFQVVVIGLERARFMSWAGLILLLGLALGCVTNSAATVALVLTGALLIRACFRSGHWRRGLIIVGLVGTGVLLRPVMEAGNSWLQAQGIVDVAAEGKDLGSVTTFRTRLLLWKAAVGMVRARPVLGWGPDGYSGGWFTGLSLADRLTLLQLELGYAPADVRWLSGDRFKHRTAGSWQAGRLRYFAPHNAVLEAAVEFGRPGVCLLGGFVVAALQRVVRAQCWRGTFPFLAYGIYLLAWFPVVVVTGYVVLLLGVMGAED